MLRKASDLTGLSVRATDGDIGSVSRILFDDERWTVRYVVADTGNWLPGRKVLLSPMSFLRNGWGSDALAVSLTREQVKGSPDIDTDQPVSRQQEARYYGYYNYPYYWGGTGLWGMGMDPYGLAEVQAPVGGGPRDRVDESEGDSHLRDSQVVTGYRVRASDGEIGRIDDFLIDDESWSIRYLVVASRDSGGPSVLISPDWVSSVGWAGSVVDVALTSGAVRNSPAYEGSAVPGHAYEQQLHAYYGRSGYWGDEESRLAARQEVAPLQDTTPGLARLENLSELEVADDDPDVRGWTVVGSDGRPVGTVEHLIIDRAQMKARYLEVGLDAFLQASGDSSHVLIPLDQVDVDAANSQVRVRLLSASSIGAMPRFAGTHVRPEDEARVRAAFGRRDTRG